ncbi:MAG: glycine--tRNA ligase [Planctomycetes bacterium]|nr:glycine--tRNA ligase [Planctomycetota bacterium]
MDKIVSLCKRRGFVFPASEIYGGIGNTYDYGPLGVELKRRVKDAWWTRMVTLRDDIVGLDSAIIQNPKTWETSGHVSNFTDPMVDCKKCKGRFRADKLDDARCPEKPSKKPGECGGELTEAREFNLMFKTNVGPVEGSGSVAYLRPETAQGIFLNFKNVLESSRVKPPFGIAQIGKSFRNEITPGNFVFRTREFEQAEMEFFIPPEQNDQWYAYWVNERFSWYVDYGIDPSKLRKYEHPQAKLAHYCKACTDVEYEYPFGWGELEGIACRTDFDLKSHSAASGKDLTYFDPESKARYTPWVVEPAAGVDRTALTFLIDAYEEQALPDGDVRTVLHFHPEIAPITVAVLPLVKKEGMPEKASAIDRLLRQARFTTFYDESAAIGRRYRRQDEVGTPYCVTIDGETLVNDVVTVRHRDSMTQESVKVADLEAYLRGAMRSWKRASK